VWTSTQTIVKILSGIIVNKLIAISLGPAGLAMIGQFQNFIAIALSVANGSIQTGIVKYAAEFKEDENMLRSLIKSSLLISLSLSAVVSLSLLVFSEYLSIKILYSDQYEAVFFFLAFAIFFYSLNLYVLSILNGFGEIKLLTIINILLSVLMVLFCFLLVYLYDLSGVLFALMLTQVVVFFLSIYLMQKISMRKIFYIDSIFNAIDKEIVNKLFRFSIATFSSGMIMTLMLMSLRHIIIQDSSIELAGIWEATWRLVSYFNLLFVLPYAIHYLPKFSSHKKLSSIRSDLKEAYKFLIPIAIIVITFILTFKRDIIELLFSSEFLEMANILTYVLIAEFFRILAFTLSNVFMAKAKVYAILQNEFIFSLTMVILSYFLINDFGFIGIGYAYFLSSILFLLLWILKFKNLKIC